MSRPQTLNYGPDTLEIKPQRQMFPLHFLSHLVGTVMAVDLDLLLKAYSNLNQGLSMGIQTRLYIASIPQA